MTADHPTRPGLSPDQVRAYHAHGWLVVPAALDAGCIARIRDECDRILRDGATRRSNHPEAAARLDLHGKPVLDRVDPVTPLSPLFAALVADPRITGPIRSLFNDQPVLFKDKLIFKPPGTTGYGAHQDYAYWEWTGIPSHDILSVQVAIDDADASNGAVILYPGLHTRRLPAPADEPRDVDPAALADALPVTPATRAGDLLIFHGLTPHRSDPNRSDRPRRTLYLTYNAARHGNYHDQYHAHRRQTPTR